MFVNILFKFNCTSPLLSPPLPSPPLPFPRLLSLQSPRLSPFSSSLLSALLSPLLPSFSSPSSGSPLSPQFSLRSSFSSSFLFASFFPKALRAGFSFRFRGPGVGSRSRGCRQPKVVIPCETSFNFLGHELPGPILTA